MAPDFFDALDQLQAKQRVERVANFVMAEFGVPPVERSSLRHEAQERFGLLTPEFVCAHVESEIHLFAVDNQVKFQLDNLEALFNRPALLSGLWDDYQVLAGQFAYVGICFRPKWLQAYVALHNYAAAVTDISRLRCPFLTAPLADRWLYVQRLDEVIRAARARWQQTRG